MSLDDISVKIGVKDVAELAEAVRLMDHVAAVSGDVLAAVNAAAAGAANVGSKAQQAVAVAPQLKGVMDVLAQAFSNVFGQWKGLNQTAREEIANLKAGLEGMVNDLRVAVEAIRADITSVGNMATVRGISEKLGKMQEGWQQQGDVGASVSAAVTSAIGPALQDLGQRMDGYARNAGAAATMAVGAVNNAVGEIKGAADALSKVQQGTDIVEQVKTIMDATLEMMKQQQVAAAPPAVAKASRRETASEEAVRSIYTLILPEWPLVRDRLYEVREKVDSIDNNTKNLGDKMDNLKEYMKTVAAASRAATKAASSGATGIEPGDEKPQAENKGVAGASGVNVGAPKVRGTPAAGKVNRNKKSVKK
jgi:hypothetical protein